MSTRLRIKRPRIVKSTPERVVYVLVQVLMGTLILLLVRALYFNHSYFLGYISVGAKEFLANLFWLVLAIVWVDPALKFLFVKKLPATNLSYIFVYFVKVFRSIKLFIVGHTDQLEWKWDARTKTAFLAILVKFFFLPIMLNTVTGNLSALNSNIEQARAGNFTVSFDSVYNLAITIIFLIDTGIFAFAYTFEASWLRSKIRSVEPTLLGWVVALSTYPPFNGLTSQAFPMFTGGATAFAQNEVSLRILQILILICHIIFVSASISLFTKGSNLTNRGIVSWGPYRIVRHPAYVVKLIAFFITGLLYAPGITYFAGWLGFTFIYVLRAITEERHLSMDPDYIEYKDKVRWKFIPGIV